MNLHFFDRTDPAIYFQPSRCKIFMQLRECNFFHINEVFTKYFYEIYTNLVLNLFFFALLIQSYVPRRVEYSVCI